MASIARSRSFTATATTSAASLARCRRPSFLSVGVKRLCTARASAFTHSSRRLSRRPVAARSTSRGCIPRSCRSFAAQSSVGTRSCVSPQKIRPHVQLTDHRPLPDPLSLRDDVGGSTGWARANDLVRLGPVRAGSKRLRRGGARRSRFLGRHWPRSRRWMLLEGDYGAQSAGLPVLFKAAVRADTLLRRSTCRHAPPRMSRMKATTICTLASSMRPARPSQRRPRLRRSLPLCAPGLWCVLPGLVDRRLL